MGKCHTGKLRVNAVLIQHPIQCGTWRLVSVSYWKWFLDVSTASGWRNEPKFIMKHHLIEKTPRHRNTQGTAIDSHLTILGVWHFLHSFFVTHWRGFDLYRLGCCWCCWHWIRCNLDVPGKRNACSKRNTKDQIQYRFVLVCLPYQLQISVNWTTLGNFPRNTQQFQFWLLNTQYFLYENNPKQLQGYILQSAETWHVRDGRVTLVHSAHEFFIFKQYRIVFWPWQWFLRIRSLYCISQTRLQVWTIIETKTPANQ